MDSSWPLRDAYAYPPAAVIGVSSSSEDSRNQTGLKLGHHSYPHFTQGGARPMIHGRIREPLFPSVWNSNSCSAGCADDHGNSSLAILSWPQTQLQCDTLETSHPNTQSSSIKLSVNSSVTPSTDGTGFQMMPSQLLSEAPINRNTETGANGCPAVSFGAMKTKCGRNSVLNDSLRVENMNFLSQPKAAIHDIVPGRCSNLVSGCPRVFCLNTSGHLVLSNTGLIGIICSCHSRHMSVPNFCDHSGSFGVEPGVSVHMDSGETIARWCKLYFQKFGIRVVEDQIGWDWPPGLSAVSVRSSSNASNKSNFYDLATLVNSPGGLTRSPQLVEILNSKVPEADQNRVEALYDRQEKSQDSRYFLSKGLSSTSCRNFYPSTDNQIIEYLMSKSSIAPACHGRRSNVVRPSASAGVSSVVNTGAFSVFKPTSQSLSVPSKSCDISAMAKEAVLMGRDTTFSNMELKLGQPYQLSHPSGNLSFSVTKPALLKPIFHPSKSLYPEEMIYSVANGGEKGEPKKHFHSNAGTSNFCIRREASQVNLRDHALGTFDGSHAFGTSVIEFSQPQKFRGDVSKNSSSRPVKHLNMPPKGCESSKVIDNVVNDSEYVYKPTYSESVAAKSHSYGDSWSAGDALGKVFDVLDHDALRPSDKDKGTEQNPDGSSSMGSAFAVKGHSESSCYLSQQSKCFFVPSIFAADNRCNHLHQSCNVLPAASDTRNLLNNPGEVHGIGSTRYEKVFEQPAVSSSVPGFIPTLLRQQRENISPYLLDEKTRLLALQQLSDLSKQHYAISSGGMNGGLANFSAPPSLKVLQSLNYLSTTKEQRHEPALTTKQTSTEFAPVPSTQFGGNSNGNDSNEHAPERGEASSRPSDNCTGVLTSCKPLLSEQGQTRHCGNENIDKPTNNDKCCQRIHWTCLQRNCSYIQHAKPLGENNESRIGSCSNFLKQQLDACNCKASISFSSKHSEDPVVPSERTFSLNQRGNLGEKLPRGIIYDASFWRDVPSKQKATCDVKHTECSADALNECRHAEVQLGDAAAKCLIESVQVPMASKEKEMSDVSSGSPSLTVAVATIEDSNVDHSTAYTGNVGRVDNPVTDEGSGVDKCWSSDEALESEKSVEFLSAGCETSLGERFSKVIKKQTYRSLLDELKLIDSLTWRKGKTRVPNMLPAHQKTHLTKSPERQFKIGRRKNDADPLLHNEGLKCSECLKGPSCCSFKGKQILQPLCKKPLVGGPSIRPVLKRGRSGFSLTKEPYYKRDLRRLNECRDRGDEHESESDENGCFRNIQVSCKKKIKKTHSSDFSQNSLIQEKALEGTEEAMKFNNLSPSSCQQANSFCKKVRPVVCGKYGEILSGEVARDFLKPTKFFSLSKILKNSKRCTLRRENKPKLTSLKELKKRSFSQCHSYFDEPSKLRKRDERGTEVSFCHKMYMDDPVEEAKTLYTGGDEYSAVNASKLENEEEEENEKRKFHAKQRPKYKETRMRSLYELTAKGEDSSSGGKTLMKTPTLVTKGIADSVPDTFCSVCRSLDSTEVNCLLKCGRCLIRVHQACYGVTRIPKGDWYCRPCKTSSKDTVCVLCGYGGGAMTRALQSRTIAKSFLKAWSVDIDRRPGDSMSSNQTLGNDNVRLHSSGSATKGDSIPVVGLGGTRPSNTAGCKIDLQNHSDGPQGSAGNIKNLKLCNSITAVLLDSRVKQWVHMVCGLWMPGTRCPNVHTMSAFDVSGVSYPGPTTVCSVCNRPGGSCIQCRVMNCNVQFHPWCAHQKGLLQSEVEGDDSENIGFYGRCLHHAPYTTCESSSHLMDKKVCGEAGNESTCARTEGFKGRKHDGFWHNLYGQLREKSRWSVSQEQIDAWVHINGTNSRMQGLTAVPMTSVEYDCRKEYVRYKQSKGWRFLVVYKSGIHALGLYTSRFISRGEMVVEYLGEIVGPRVSDKRENEYESGKKLQYKSACYFFRIDREHIIDATRKGGIARFVNHSCSPNCVAKVISFRSEKKVVFFADRDIYPGEEITYDYNFNHEDEGKKIPCFCNSKNCRRFLN